MAVGGFFGRDQRRIIDNIRLRLLDLCQYADIHQVARVSDMPSHCCGRRGLRAGQVNIGIVAAAPAGEVPVGGPYRNAIMGRHLPHPDAGSAGTLQDAAAGFHQIRQHPVLNKLRQHLPGAGRHCAVNILMHLMPLQDARRPGNIGIGSIGTAADKYRTRLHTFCLAGRTHLIRHGGLRHQRLQPVQIDFHHLVVGCTLLRLQRHIVALSPLGL